MNDPVGSTLGLNLQQQVVMNWVNLSLGSKYIWESYNNGGALNGCALNVHDGFQYPAWDLWDLCAHKHLLLHSTNAFVDREISMLENIL